MHPISINDQCQSKLLKLVVVMVVFEITCIPQLAYDTLFINFQALNAIDESTINHSINHNAFKCIHT